MLDHFEIRVGDINRLGNFVIVSVLWYARGISAPDPFSHSGNVIFVTPPNIIERIFGITFRRKVEAAKIILIQKATKHLEQNRKLNEQLKD